MTQKLKIEIDQYSSEPILICSGHRLKGYWNDVIFEGVNSQVIVFNSYFEDPDSEYGCNHCSLSMIHEVDCNEMPQNIELNYFQYSNKIYKAIYSLNITKTTDLIYCEYHGRYAIDTWKEDIAITKFLALFENQLKQLNKFVEFNVDYSDNLANIMIVFKLVPKGRLGSVLEHGLELINNSHYLALQDNLDKSDFIEQFNFPHKYKDVFTQYLIYFGKFLEDLGLNAEVSVHNKEEKTLLRIIPENEGEAYDVIHSALATYLSIPSFDFKTTISSKLNLEDSIKLQQLVSNVEHLKSQLRLAESTILMQKTHIENLSLGPANTEPRVLPSKEIIDYWEPVEGIRIKQYKGKFFDVDLPLFVKKIKDIIK